MIHVPRDRVKAFDFQGLTIADYVPGQIESGSIAEIVVGPGARHKPARSTRSDKFYFGLGGRVTFQVEGRPVHLIPGDVLVISKGEWFSYANESTEAARLLLFHSPSFDLAAEEFRDEIPSCT